MKRRIRLITTLCLAGALALAGSGCASKTPALPEAPTEIVPVAGLTTPVPAATGTPAPLTPGNGEKSEEKKVSAVLYYQDASGYLVPVMRELPYTEGIAKAALEKLIAGEEEQQALASRGVTAPIPEGSTVELDIAQGTATVDIGLTSLPEGPTDESCMVASVVNTLMEFKTVDQVKLRFNGQQVEKLPLGTEVKEVYTQTLENMDPMGQVSSANAQTQLYFVNRAGSFLVPVKRITTGEITARTAAEHLMDPGPTGQLVSLLPTDCRILGVEVSEDGVATVNVSEEFLSLSALPASEQMAVKGMRLAMTSIPGVSDMALTVEGEPYEPVAATVGLGTGGSYLNVMP